jgi:hypothetical protein
MPVVRDAQRPRSLLIQGAESAVLAAHKRSDPISRSRSGRSDRQRASSTNPRWLESFDVHAIGMEPRCAVRIWVRTINDAFDNEDKYRMPKGNAFKGLAVSKRTRLLHHFSENFIVRVVKAFLNGYQLDGDGTGNRSRATRSCVRYPTRDVGEDRKAVH